MSFRAKYDLFLEECGSMKSQILKGGHIFMNKFILKYSQHIVAFAVMVSTYAENRTCFVLFKQPKVPDSVKKLRKF